MRKRSKTASFIVLFVLGSFLFPAGQSEAAVKCRRPLATLGSPVYYSWYDHDALASKTKRYDCVTGKPYDGHKGTDFKASIGTSIAAGAYGSIYYRYDACYTENSPGCGGGFGNHVRMDHLAPADGKGGMISIYAHMKKGTAAYLQCGVSCGAYIGQTGDSGDSTAPHLHFEIRPNGFSSSSPIDPFSGSCSQSTSYWNIQSDPPSTACFTSSDPVC